MAHDGIVLMGAAFPRTGTMSVKNALEHLGVGRCYHMHEVFLNPPHVEIWNAACEGRMPDWKSFLSGYAATLDTPACHFWRELAECFPRAKVLLLTRDPESWYDSMNATTYPVVMGPEGETDPALAMARRIFFETHLNGRFEDREYAISVYRQYCDDVRKSVTAERLLEYEVSQGWEPLCEFLGCRVPEEPFPKNNTREMFQARADTNR